MPAKSKVKKSRKENRKKGSGRPPLELCLPCSTVSPSLYNRDISNDDDELHYICTGEYNYLIAISSFKYNEYFKLNTFSFKS